MKILPSLTTSKARQVSPFIEDILKYRITELALYPTCLDAEGRKRLYRDLEKVEGLLIPHVHLRTDYLEEEILYLEERFKTEVFNIHPEATEFAFPDMPERFRARVFVENVEVPPSAEELEGLGGICADFAHLENAKLFNRKGYYKTMIDLMKRYPVGCCHLSAIRIGTPNEWTGEWDHHTYQSLNELEFLGAYKSYLPLKWVSLELENSLMEQLRAIEYLEALLT